MLCPLTVTSSWVIGIFSPAARRIWRWTRSTPADHLGDGMLDLDPGIDLEEEEFVTLDQELTVLTSGTQWLVAAAARMSSRASRSPKEGLPR